MNSFISKHWSALIRPTGLEVNNETLKEQLKNESFKEKTILIKASRGMALERILDCF